MDRYQGNAEVTIRKVTPSNEGLYYCMASNKSGRAKASATLHVLGKLNSLKTDTRACCCSFGNTEVTIRKVTPSDEGLYYCMASNKSGRAKASATLHVLGKLNSLKTDTRACCCSFGNTEVTICKVTPSDEGLYYCMASNKSGRAKASATLHVLGKLNSLKTDTRACCCSFGNTEVTLIQYCNAVYSIFILNQNYFL